MKNKKILIVVALAMAMVFPFAGVMDSDEGIPLPYPAAL